MVKNKSENIDMIFQKMGKTDVIKIMEMAKNGSENVSKMRRQICNRDSRMTRMSNILNIAYDTNEMLKTMETAEEINEEVIERLRGNKRKISPTY